MSTGSALSREILSTSFTSSSSSLQLASSFVFKPEPIDIRVTFPKNFLKSKIELNSFTVGDLLNIVEQEIKTSDENGKSKFSLIPTDEDGCPMDDLPSLSKREDLRTVGASEFVIIDQARTPVLFIRLVVADGLEEATDFFDCDDDLSDDPDGECDSDSNARGDESSALGTLLLIKNSTTSTSRAPVENTCEITETTSTCSSSIVSASKAGRTSISSHILIDYSRSRNRAKSVSFHHIRREKKGEPRSDGILPSTIVIKACYPSSDVWNDFKTVIIASKSDKNIGKSRSFSEPIAVKSFFGNDRDSSKRPIDFYDTLLSNALDDVDEEFEAGCYYYEDGTDDKIVVEGNIGIGDISESMSAPKISPMGLDGGNSDDEDEDVFATPPLASQFMREGALPSSPVSPTSSMFFSDFEI